ncbi:MAG: serine protein kinase PrkA [Deltaproteobacteria bacterium]|nr:serine protein kinase PrkA [Deltaproteobacteria bacterium]
MSAKEVARRQEDRKADARSLLDTVAASVEHSFQRSQRLLSFREYLELAASHPVRHGRSAARYVRDAFQHYGTIVVERPWGKRTRFLLFDAPWAAPGEAGREPRLVGHEDLQGEIYRCLCNFAGEGTANRLVLLHGPNGSAKSTAAACVLRALEHYATLEEGALYRFHWIFPKRETVKGSIGFGGGGPSKEPESYAHLEENEVDARLVIELRDHPLFLIPAAERRELLDRWWKDAAAAGKPPEWLYCGELSHKNRQIFDALLTSYRGSLRDVLRHVQVERYFISQRYRVGAVTLGPQMHVDAGERQISADRSLAALPTALQATTLFEAFGELVDASGGVLEFSDLLKRPIDALRYLQLTLETGQAALPQQTVFTNVVMIGSANEIHLAAFRQHPEFPSFRERLEFVRVPYLRSFFDEERIYELLVVPQIRRHVAPHAVRTAAEFAVLTRLFKPEAGQYDKPLGAIVGGLTAVEKMVLYAEGKTPERLGAEQRKLLAASVARIYEETAARVEYEGIVGASPRTIRSVLLDAAQSDQYRCLSPFGVLDELGELCQRTAEFDWLQLERRDGGYHDHAAFRERLRERLTDRLELDLRRASGLVEEVKYGELFRRYVEHVSHWVKGEKVRNPVTGKDEEPDEKLMREIESLLGVQKEREEQRHGLISRIAAWALDHPGRAPDLEEIFPGHVQKLESTAFAKLRKPFALLLRDLVALLREEGGAIGLDRHGEAEAALARLVEIGYCRRCALDAASEVLRERFADLVT